LAGVCLEDKIHCATQVEPPVFGFASIDDCVYLDPTRFLAIVMMAETVILKESA
jgi:hypothetical protein